MRKHTTMLIVLAMSAGAAHAQEPSSWLEFPGQATTVHVEEGQDFFVIFHTALDGDNAAFIHNSSAIDHEWGFDDTKIEFQSCYPSSAPSDWELEGCADDPVNDQTFWRAKDPTGSNRTYSIPGHYEAHAKGTKSNLGYIKFRAADSVTSGAPVNSTLSTEASASVLTQNINSPFAWVDRNLSTGDMVLGDDITVVIHDSGTGPDAVIRTGASTSTEGDEWGDLYTVSGSTNTFYVDIDIPSGGTLCEIGASGTMRAGKSWDPTDPEAWNEAGYSLDEDTEVFSAGAGLDIGLGNFDSAETSVTKELEPLENTGEEPMLFPAHSHRWTFTLKDKDVGDAVTEVDDEVNRTAGAAEFIMDVDEKWATTDDGGEIVMDKAWALFVDSSDCGGGSSDFVVTFRDRDEDKIEYDSNFDSGDLDQDGVAGINDNCRRIPNPDQTDSDNTCVAICNPHSNPCGSGDILFRERHGDACDADTNDSGHIRKSDYIVQGERTDLKDHYCGWGSYGSCAPADNEYDLDDDGDVDTDDLAVWDNLHDYGDPGFNVDSDRAGNGLHHNPVGDTCYSAVNE